MFVRFFDVAGMAVEEWRSVEGRGVQGRVIGGKEVAGKTWFVAVGNGTMMAELSGKVGRANTHTHMHEP
jgi:hypothetical protein